MVTVGNASKSVTQGVLLSLHHLLLHSNTINPSLPVLKKVHVHVHRNTSFLYSLTTLVSSDILHSH